MEKGVNELHSDGFLKAVNSIFHVEKVDASQYSPLTLAYIGDGVYDLIIRTIIVEEGNAPVNTLNRKVSGLVNATFQSRLVRSLLPHLTEHETSIFLRGRNAKSYTVAKNAKLSDYRYATGFEALMGFLYLENRLDRALELIRMGLQECLDNDS